MEFVIRRSLEQDDEELVGLYPENPGKPTSKPTAERILKTFSKISLTIIIDTAGNELMRRLTPLSSVQQQILQRLALDTAIYQHLEIPHIGFS